MQSENAVRKQDTPSIEYCFYSKEEIENIFGKASSLFTIWLNSSHYKIPAVEYLALNFCTLELQIQRKMHESDM